MSQTEQEQILVAFEQAFLRDMVSTPLEIQAVVDEFFWKMITDE